MSRSDSPTQIAYVFFLFSIIFFFVVTTGDQGCSSSCGDIPIEFPFRLKNDPARCGLSYYQLTCIGNKTLILKQFSGKYYVTNILYNSSRMHVVNVNSKISSSGCAVPSWSISDQLQSGPLTSSSGHLQNGYYMPEDQDYTAVIFMNCSKKIKKNDGYSHQLLPCLNPNPNWTSNGFIYIVERPYWIAVGIDFLAPSCSLLSLVAYGGIAPSNDTTTDVFHKLENGFWLGWSYMEIDYTVANLLGICFKIASKNDRKEYYITPMMPYPLSFQIILVRCLYDYKANDRNFASNRLRYNSRNFKAALISTLIILAFPNIFLILAVARFTIAPVTIYVFLCHQFWKMRVPMDKVEKFLRFQETLSPARYSYSDIVAMTRNFNKKLGQGGCGSVFTGLLPGGPSVAIKMLDNSKCKGEDFISEVSTIGRIHHLNVVRLLGFCSEGSKRALIYEFMPNGSLDKYIFSSNGTNRHFTMEKLNEIALGVARGIDYLHRGCDMRILHFDIKPQNILLDHDFKPKIADFGLAKLYPKDYSHVSDCVARGTVGYIAPELVSRSFGAISNKSDVYSFGMLLMEMSGGRRNVDRRAEHSSQIYYPSWIYDRLEERESEFEICNAIEIDDMERKLSKVGLWCIQMRPSDRPSMSKVVEMLEADVDEVPMPPKPFLNNSTEPIVIIRESQMDSSYTELSIISENEWSSLASVSTS